MKEHDDDYGEVRWVGYVEEKVRMIYVEEEEEGREEVWW